MPGIIGIIQCVLGVFSMLLKEIVAANIRKHRSEAGLSQKELAKLSGLTHVHINQIELMAKNITLDTLEAISIALKVPLAEFIQNTKIRSKKPSPRLKQSLQDTMLILEAYLASLDDTK